jgi:protoporphyrinogen oxidase
MSCRTLPVCLKKQGAVVVNFAVKAPVVWRRLTKPIAIIGAGIAGLTAAFDIERRGLQAAVFESGRAVGGLATSFKDAEGYSYDFGAHFVSNRLANALGASDISRTVRHYGEAVTVGGRSYGYPFGLASSPRYAVSAVAARLRPNKIENAADWFRNAYGAALADEVAIPLAEAWSGAPASELSPAVGEKLSAGVMKTLYLKAASRVAGRAICNGYSHEMPESPSVYHVYPEGGVSRLLEPTMAKIGNRIALESRVEKIFVERGRVAAISVNGREIGVSAAISTAPVHILPKLVEGTNALDELASFRYRPMVFVNLRFEGRKLLPDTMLWVPDRSQPFFRVTEAPFSMPWLAPEGRTQLTFDLGCEVGDSVWTMSDEELAKLCLDGLCRIYPHLRASYIGPGGMLKTPFAYPVYLSSYEPRRQEFARGTGVAGLYSIGRNGEFGHLLMEDIYWRTLKRMQHVADYVTRDV